MDEDIAPGLPADAHSESRTAVDERREIQSHCATEDLEMTQTMDGFRAISCRPPRQGAMRTWVTNAVPSSQPSVDNCTFVDRDERNKIQNFRSPEGTLHVFSCSFHEPHNLDL